MFTIPFKEYKITPILKNYNANIYIIFLIQFVEAL